jgi:hypothetical protein
MKLFFVWTAPRMQEIAFLNLRKSNIFWGRMPPDLPPRQKCLGQSKILVTRLTVPVTFASAERSFSKLKLLRTVMRSVMNQERLGELWTLACERDLTDTIDLAEIANPWTKLTKRGHLIEIRCLTANCTYSCKIPNKWQEFPCFVLNFIATHQLTKSRSGFTFQWWVGLISWLHPPSQNQYVRPWFYTTCTCNAHNMKYYRYFQYNTVSIDTTLSQSN